jgi:murein DD-endopeptidase MepM/ murein hydrolase activator NlpD
MKRSSVVLMAILTLIWAAATLGFTVTSPFGWRNHPVSGKRQFHRGVDIKAPHGTPIVAMFAGEVVWANRHQGYGLTVLVDHGGCTYTLYGHCDRIFVRPKQRVAAGEVIATVGSTGISTGAHLHLEYWHKGRYIDPLTLFRPHLNQRGNHNLVHR